MPVNEQAVLEFVDEMDMMPVFTDDVGDTYCLEDLGVETGITWDINRKQEMVITTDLSEFQTPIILSEVTDEMWDLIKTGITRRLTQVLENFEVIDDPSRYDDWVIYRRHQILIHRAIMTKYRVLPYEFFGEEEFKDEWPVKKANYMSADKVRAELIRLTV